jgi:hypothetical protein
MPDSVSFDLHKSIAFMFEQLPIETYLMNLFLVRRDSTDAALTLEPCIFKWKRLLQEFRQLTLSPINTAVHDDVTEIAFHKCPFLEMLTVDWKTIYRSDFKTNLK